MTSSPLRFGLIGTGRIGQVHAANIAAHPDATLAWVADPFAEGAKRIAERYGARDTTNSADVFAPSLVDAVLIASPTPTHVELIGKAVDTGLPVLCEKPIDLDIGRVNALHMKVSDSGVPIALGFNRRFDASFSAARRRVEAGEIGRLEQLTIISRDPTPPPADYLAGSGGIFRDMMIHDFDMARSFLPDIIEVSATGSVTFDDGARQHKDFDTAVATLRASTGALVTIVNSRHSAIGYDQRLEAFGSEGIISVANAPTSLVSVSTARAVEAKPPYQDFFLERYADAYRAELDAFIHLARGEDSTSPSFEDGRFALLLADAAQKSATERVAISINLA